ncbi:MAG: D-tyrosyl-tRNA(Tyr) deacylase [Candidatus Thermoplasmatota archaeon]|nr:D-tyrosyl-tRNA(Tyr) deacylase [Candidatus Thermoplasmatota archaeon]
MKTDVKFIYSTEDPASLNIRDALVSSGIDRELFHEINQRSIYSDFPENRDGMAGKTLVFLSRHSSEKKVNSLTVHPVGNFSSADLGGAPGELAESDPWVQSAILRSIKNVYKGDKYNITLEATHHGPRSSSRIVFAEIGTGPENWNDPEALDALAQGLSSFNVMDYPNYVAAGGGHYAPKFTDALFSMKINIGHIISKYRMDEISDSGLIQAVDKSPDCKGFILDKKGLRSSHLEMIRSFAKNRNLDIIEL